jgi:hypothetical protein
MASNLKLLAATTMTAFSLASVAAFAGPTPSHGQPIETPQYFDVEKCKQHPEECQQSKPCKRTALRCTRWAGQPFNSACLKSERVCVGSAH